MISIVDYGMGNLGSVINMFKKLNVSVEVVNTPLGISKAKKLLLPGVGSFDKAIENIQNSGLKESLNKKALIDKIPVLGICLGMQLLTRGSEEGKMPGFGWIAADTKRIPQINNIKVPHMGWNSVIHVNPSKLTENLTFDSKFYFVHSYIVEVDNLQNSILKCEYGKLFDAVVQNDNIYGAQFHPEKSHKYGMQILLNFSKI